jgi:DNA-binding LacI/PurR family transcriptional regulator
MKSNADQDGSTYVPAHRPTMGDIAVHLGVSRQLVSLVLRNQPGASPQTRQRVFAAAAELGYSPDRAAQLLRRNRSGHFGVLFTISQPFDLDLVEQIYPAAEAAGYEVVLSAMIPTRQEEKAVEQLVGSRSEALILIGPELSDDRLSALAKRLPVVEFGRRMAVPGIDAVRSDDVRGERTLVEHIIQLGHTDILHIDGGTLPGSKQRRSGYRRSMRKHGLDDKIRELKGDYTEESGARAARQLLADGTMPTAIVAGNDRCAVGVIEILIRAGIRVPQDVSVAGYDDSHISRYSYLDLTTVRQDTAALARAAVGALVERLEQGRSDDRDIVVPPELVIRSTTGKLTT